MFGSHGMRHTGFLQFDGGQRDPPDRGVTTYLWHLRLGHFNPNRIHGLVKSVILNSLAFEPIPMCVNHVWKVK